MGTKRILLVDAEEETRELFHEVLERRGYKVTACEGGEAAQIAKRCPVFAAFVDVRAPGISSVQCLREIKAARPEAHLVMITGYTRDEAVEEALNLGCYVCMMKPLKLLDILGVIEVLQVGVSPLARAA